MLTNLLTSPGLSSDALEADINTYINSLQEAHLIQDTFSSSTRTLLTKILAGYGSFILFKYNSLREETYLSTAKLESSVYSQASALGYNINRMTAPRLTLKYLSVPTILVSFGDILGYYGDYDIICIEDKLIEKGDEVVCAIGKFNVDTLDVQLVDDSLYAILSPDGLKAIDNQQIQLFLNNNKVELGKDIEELIINHNPVDFSTSIYNSKLILTTSGYIGKHKVVPTDNIVIKYIETDGFLTSFDYVEANATQDYTVVDIINYGTNGDSLAKIKRLAPLLFSSMRRGVTESDYKYLIEYHPYINNAEVESDKGIPGSYTLSFPTYNINTDYVFNINDYVITLQSGTKTISQFLDYVVLSFSHNTFMTFEKVNNTIKVTVKSARYGSIEVSDNITKTTIINNIPPKCCTAKVYYINYNRNFIVGDSSNELSSYEKLELSQYIRTIKLVGLNVLLIPATAISTPITINISYNNNVLSDTIKSEIELELRKLLRDKYEKILNSYIDYTEVQADITQYLYNGNYPIKAIQVVPFDKLLARKDTVYLLDTININYL